MKIQQHLTTFVVVALTVLAFSGCTLAMVTPDADATTMPVTSHATETQQESLPESPLMPTVVSPLDLPNSPLPSPDAEESRTDVSWAVAKQKILDAEVAEVFQAHSREVVLVLKDGSTLHTIEPKRDEVFRVLEQCGEQCDDVLRATE